MLQTIFLSKLSMNPDWQCKWIKKIWIHANFAGTMWPRGDHPYTWQSWPHNVCKYNPILSVISYSCLLVTCLIAWLWFVRLKVFAIGWCQVQKKSSTLNLNILILVQIIHLCELDIEIYSCIFCNRVATKIFKGFGEALFKEFMKGWEPVSNVHYTRPGTCINRPLH